MQDLGKISFPRCFLGNLSVNANISLHSFCDASANAYSSVIYLRLQDCNEMNVYFVQAKNRVAQISYKKLDARKSIPRLELMAANIGVRLTQTVCDALRFENIDVFYWSDSTTVLSWIKRQRNWDVFVSNRVKEIRSLSSVEQWHVPGTCNPADIPSCGCTADQLSNSCCLEGPARLHIDKYDWAENRYEVVETAVSTEEKKGKIDVGCSIMNSLSQSKVNERWFDKYSSFNKIIRIAA